MSYTITESRNYEGISAEIAQTTALAAISALEGKLQEQTDNTISAKFHKTILGKVLGDRTQLEVAINPQAESGTELTATIYPLDAVGRKLQFGARKGVSQTVMKWFFAHFEHRLPSE